MGRAACAAIRDTGDLELAVAIVRDVDRAPEFGDVPVAAALDALTDAGVDVAVELTGPATVGDHLSWLLGNDIHAVVGATGLSDTDLHRARTLATTTTVNALIVPNFAIGAVLMMEFAAKAAKHLPDVEIVELHHDQKLDAPSGTALRTAEVISQARPTQPRPAPGDERARGRHHAGVPVHSVRLPGLVAHQTVIFGGPGQTLRLQHDALDRSAFMPGILLACRQIHRLTGLHVGLEHVM